MRIFAFRTSKKYIITARNCKIKYQNEILTLHYFIKDIKYQISHIIFKFLPSSQGLHDVENGEEDRQVNQGYLHALWRAQAPLSWLCLFFPWAGNFLESS